MPHESGAANWSGEDYQTEESRSLPLSKNALFEDAVDAGNEMGGFSLDLIKAYNTFGRFAILQIMVKLGMLKSVLHAWVASLDRLVRYFRRCYQHNRSSESMSNSNRHYKDQQWKQGLIGQSIPRTPSPEEVALHERTISFALQGLVPPLCQL